MKKVIISADDFGYSNENNKAVLIGYKSGNITSAGLMANMTGFQNAVEEIIPQIPDIDLGFHFNIIEGKSLTNPDLLCNPDAAFNRGFLNIFLNQNNPQLLAQIEAEFRAQIEKILNYYPVSHIDSHVHIHAVPAVFKITVKLAKEYNIKYVRTQKEIPYIVPNKMFNKRFPINIIKNILLNILSYNNEKKVKDIYTNNYLTGVLYTGYMDEEAIYKGLAKIKKENSVTEVLFHPYLPQTLNNNDKRNSYREFLITKTPNLKTNLEKSGFELTSFSKLV